MAYPSYHARQPDLGTRAAAYRAPLATGRHTNPMFVPGPPLLPTISCSPWTPSHALDHRR
jgi:hypothetical protein